MLPVTSIPAGTRRLLFLKMISFRSPERMIGGGKIGGDFLINKAASRGEFRKTNIVQNDLLIDCSRIVN
jgi:hypothetical protein